MRAGMASDGIVTVLTQYLQLKLGYVTSDQVRSCPSVIASADSASVCASAGLVGSQWHQQSLCLCSEKAECAPGSQLNSIISLWISPRQAAACLIRCTNGRR